jgi:DNA-binding FadR family transcriptional regulator
MIAAQLRPHILDGSFEELPTQDVLMKQFGVSYPSVREALRILETEGLVTVRRGLAGGATVHRPSNTTAAYAMSLLLESERVHLSDVALAISMIEPLCAALCAESPDRAGIADLLDEANNLAAARIEDGAEFTRLSRRFHDRLISECGNRTLILLAGVLEALWSSHEQEWAERATAGGSYPLAKLREEVLKAHRRVAATIRDGKVEEARRLATRHLSESQRFVLDAGQDRTVKSSALRSG